MNAKHKQGRQRRQRRRRRRRHKKATEILMAARIKRLNDPVLTFLLIGTVIRVIIYRQKYSLRATEWLKRKSKAEKSDQDLNRELIVEIRNPLRSFDVEN